MDLTVSVMGRGLRTRGGGLASAVLTVTIVVKVALFTV
jgi:hypothetical protein